MNKEKAEKIITQICDIVIDVLKIDKKNLHLDTKIKKNFEDYTVFEIIILIEELFQIRINNKDVIKIKTLENLLDYILKLPEIRPQYDLDGLVDKTTEIIDLLYPNREPFGFYDGPLGSGEIKNMEEDLKGDD